ncbi:alpha/beta hydrolase [Actinomadura barringtoniae]|uniref:Alpha/beta hydrolase n=1 Tax=Actinomadura barringtoniae TaxID=1427535 RepID=A0A939PNX8_9ACTN|nr:alpha/beta hydrolase [Actinomadura barringtoniae]MBO2453419.1 alpha/beta hydrolase [Actinomadura barringtoniae]
MNRSTDVLGSEYEAIELPMVRDDEGEVVATLVRRRCAERTARAVLYLHGFVDYFFQDHLADFYVERGFDFYALDLRKHGRSLRPHQTPNYTDDLARYYAEIDMAVRIVREDDEHDVLLLNGHSTGGLTAALWADRVSGRGLVDGVFLNSPFLDVNAPPPVRWAVCEASRLLSKAVPKGRLPLGLSDAYARSLHRDHDGEWDFDRGWKPLDGFPMRVGWLAAVRNAQRAVHDGLAIDVPVLVMAAARSVKPGPQVTDITSADVVLNADDIVRWAPRLGSHVTIVRIEGGMHDLVLSAEDARKRAFAELDRWMRCHLRVG